MKELIHHTGVSKFLTQLRTSGESIKLTRLQANSGRDAILGNGSIGWVDGKFQIEWDLPDHTTSDDLIRSLKDEWDKPRTYTARDKWTALATTRDGLHLEFRVFPPETWSFITGSSHRIKLTTCQLNIVRPAQDSSEGQVFLDRLADLEIAGHPTDEAEALPRKALHHAVFPGLKSPLRLQRSTQSVVKNDFLGEFEEQKKNTWMSEREGMTFALIQHGQELHAFLEFCGSICEQSEEEEAFSAFLDAVAFTHGIRPWPMIREISHGTTDVKCEIGSLEPFSKSSAAPLTDLLLVNDSESESMLLAAFDFFVNKDKLQEQIRRLHSLLCESHDGTLIQHSDLLALCTVFEGAVNSVFDHLSLKKGLNCSEAAGVFEQVKTGTIEWMEANMTSETSEVASAWDRMMGIVKSASFIRTEEKLHALSAHYGFPWSNDVDEVFAMWKKQRNPIAHGSKRKESDSDMHAMFAAWSRMTGFINRLFLAEMRYSGCISYSPMEEGLILKRITPISQT